HRAYHDPAGLGLPPRIDDWAPLAADNFAVPHPRFGIDRLSHRTKQSQTRQVMLFYPRVAPFYESPDGSGRGVEDADAVLRYYPPEAIVLGEIRRAFIHYDRRARRQRPVHGVTVAGYPPDIRRAPVDVVLLQVEHPLHRHQDMSQVPAGRMHDALGFAGRAAGVEGVERMLGVELGGLAAGVVRGNELVPPQVAPFAHLDLVADPLEHDDFLDRWALFQRLIDIVLELDDLPAAPSAVRGNTYLRFRVVDPIGQRFGREAAEYHRVNRTDSRACQHRDRRLRHQRQVDRDALAILDAQAFQRIGAPAHFVGEHLVGQHARVARLALPNQRRFVATGTAEMAIEAIVGGVDRAADEPLRKREIPLQRLAERLKPIKVPRAFGPESLRIGVSALAQRLVLVEALDPRPRTELGGGRKLARFGQRRIYMSRFGRRHRSSTCRLGLGVTRDREPRAFSGSDTASRRRHFRAGSN